MAQQHLRNMLAYLDVPTFGQPEAFIYVTDAFFANGEIANAASRQFLQGWMDKYCAWVRKIASAAS
jgi:chromate reductase